MNIVLESWQGEHQQSGADLLGGERGDLALIRARDGLFLVPKNDQYVGKSMLAYGEYNQQEQYILNQILAVGMGVVEIGAHMGSHTVGMAKKVGQSGDLWAFEPQPFLHRVLNSNLLLNGISWAKAYCLGLSDQEGEVRVQWPNYGVLGNFGGMDFTRSNDQAQEQAGGKVELRVFDEIFTGKKLHLMKIDVEGMESKVLQGAEQSIRRFKPVLYLENDRKSQSQSLIEYLWGLDYSLWWSLPPLYSAKNYYHHPFNHFGNTVSVNMLCFHKDTNAKLNGFTEITDSSSWPL